MTLLIAWGLTVAVEYAIWMIWLHRRPLVHAGYCILVNTFTQPLAVHGYWSLIDLFAPVTIGHHLPSLFIIEVSVVLVEWLLIRMLCEVSWRRAFWISFSANGITASMSFIF